MNIIATFITDLESAKLVKPGKRSLDHPAEDAQSATVPHFPSQPIVINIYIPPTPTGAGSEIPRHILFPTPLFTTLIYSDINIIFEGASLL